MQKIKNTLPLLRFITIICMKFLRLDYHEHFLCVVSVSTSEPLRENDEIYHNYFSIITISEECFASAKFSLVTYIVHFRVLNIKLLELCN